MDLECRTHAREYLQILVGNLQEKGHTKELTLDGTIILKLTLKK